MKCYRPERGRRIGDVELGTRAKVIAVVPSGDRAAEIAVRAREQGADLLEVRLDLEEGLAPDGVADRLRAVRDAAGLPIVATARLPGQRGRYRGGEPQRLELLQAAAPLADLVDVELDATIIRSSVATACRDAGSGLLVSFHDTVQTPSDEGLEALAREAVEEVGADVYKICPLARDLLDVARLLRHVQWFRDTFDRAQIVGMALGSVGSPSRLVSPAFGACMTYGYVEGEAAVVPGQYAIGELRSAWDEEAAKGAARERMREALAELAGDTAPPYQLR